MKFNIYFKDGYSDRINKTRYKSNLQIRKLDKRTRNQIYSILYDFIINSTITFPNISNIHSDVNGYNHLIEYIYVDIFSMRIDQVPIKYSFSLKGSPPQIDLQSIFNDVENVIINSSYEKVFTFIEAIESFLKRYDYSFSDKINKIFENENVQHRIIGCQISDITDDNEIKEINQVLNYNDVSSEHIKKAAYHLYNRNKPDYENSVKESISAIEAKCKLILNDKNVTLGQALLKLEKNDIKIHSALKEAFNKLFGYTSDEPGVRHGAGLDMNTTFEEAKFMLVTCTAFLNYLVAINEKKKGCFKII